MSHGSALLSVRELHVSYGAIQALHDASIDVLEGEVVSVLGANGAGKSSLLRAISGLAPVVSGTIHFGGKSIVGDATERISKAGIAHVPEGRHIFPGLTVMENLLVATSARTDTGDTADDLERVMKLFPVLDERHGQHGWSLSGGEQQMLAIGRALMARPRLMMLDEPSLGLAPKLVREVLRKVRAICDEGTTVLLVEQNGKAALRISNRAYALRNGQVVFSGTAAELAAENEMKRAYLGA